MERDGESWYETTGMLLPRILRMTLASIVLGYFSLLCAVGQSPGLDLLHKMQRAPGGRRV
jgi:hypothetical protein